VAQVVAATRQVLDQNQDGMESVLDMLAGGSQKLFEAINALGEAHHAVERISSPEKRAFAYKDTVVSAMLAVRAVADELEGIVADDLWPLPKYREMLFQY
jgi:glutamine synthetase